MQKFASILGLMFVSLVGLRASDDTPLPTDNPGAVALYQACDKGDLVTVKSLLGGGAPIDGQVGRLGATPLIAAVDGAHLDVLKWLIDYRANLDFADHEGSTPLLHACWTDHIDCALALIDAGANVNLGSHAGRTPLMYAAKKGSDRIIEALIAHKVNVDANCNQGTAMQWAASNNQLSTIKLLGAAGANPNLMPVGGDPGTYSVLGCAAANNNLDMIDYLCSLKADVNGASREGHTPIMAAVDYGRAEAITKLLEYGANPDLKNKDGQTALILACVWRNKQCIQALVDGKADVNATDARGETALTIAGDTGEVDLVEMLSKRGARREDLHIIPKPDPRWPITPSHAWALAVGAIYTQRDGANPKILGGGDAAAGRALMLARDWDIHDKQSLLSELDDLRDHGHHSLYQTQGAALVAMSDDQFNQLLAAHPEEAVRIKATRDSYVKWKDRSGLAWDLCRSANLVNAGYAAHYLSAHEAWDRLLAVAHLAQAKFSSWQEMSDNFLDGRQIWANERDPRFEACSQLLLNPKDPNSPWNQNPWTTNLTDD